MTNVKAVLDLLKGETKNLDDNEMISLNVSFVKDIIEEIERVEKLEKELSLQKELSEYDSDIEKQLLEKIEQLELVISIGLKRVQEQEKEIEQLNKALNIYVEKDIKTEPKNSTIDTFDFDVNKF